MHYIELDAGGLCRQAHMTATEYMRNAVYDIDELLGKGYAKAHPDLIAAYMRVAADDYRANFTGAVVQDLIEQLREGVRVEHGDKP